MTPEEREAPDIEHTREAMREHDRRTAQQDEVPETPPADEGGDQEPETPPAEGGDPDNG
jgi:hypothetical protein